MQTISVIITAGGVGKRMGSDLPKQFLLLKNKPILMITIERFHKMIPNASLIVTLPTIWHRTWSELCVKFGFDVPHTTIDGGAERYDSVKNALRLVTTDIVMIHDGVRPLFSDRILAESLEKVGENLGVVPALAVSESIRRVQEDKSQALNRNEYRLIQTPQVFNRKALSKAYEIEYQTHFTDDASVFEHSGGVIEIIAGNKENIKITEPLDLQIADLFWDYLEDA